MTSPYSTGLRAGPRQTGRGPIPSPLASRAWDRTVTLEIAGTRVALVGLPAAVAQAVHARCRLFVTQPGPDDATDLVVRVCPAVIKGYLDYERQGGSTLYRLETRAHAGRLHVWSYAFAGWFEIDGSAGEINLCDSAIEPPERSIENFLRVAIAWKAAQSGRFLFHASGLVRGGKAYLFFGPSGSGKTTVTRLSPYDVLLNDDCVLVGLEDGRFVARGVPFKGIEAGGAQDVRAYPIAAIYRLVQARQVRIEPLSAARAVAEIAASVPFVSERPEGLEGVCATIEPLVRQVPVSRLHFRLAPDFWDAIEERLVG